MKAKDLTLEQVIAICKSRTQCINCPMIKVCRNCDFSVAWLLWYKELLQTEIDVSRETLTETR